MLSVDFILFLFRIVPLLLEDCEGVPSTLSQALTEKNAQDLMRKFLSDPQVHSLMIERIATKGLFIRHLIYDKTFENSVIFQRKEKKMMTLKQTTT